MPRPVRTQEKRRSKPTKRGSTGDSLRPAFEGAYKHIGELASAHERAVEEFGEMVRPADSVTAAVYAKLAWMARQTTVILGDPTVRVLLAG